MDNQEQLRASLWDVAIRLNDTGLNHGATGNCSVRTAQGFLITPSGVANRNLTPETIVELNMEGEKITVSDFNASSEWLFHKDLYLANENINAVIHSHAPYATSVSTLKKDLTPFHYMIAVAGGKDIRCADYALFGTQALSDHILKAMQDRKACLLANHGLLTVGENLDIAFDITEEIEHLCMVYLNAKKLGEPEILTDVQMEEVVNRFQSYSRWRKD